MNNQTASLSRGSEWFRWEPHIHAPGTIMNNQFSGEAAWENYINALETATPSIRAIGITDYYVTDTYRKVLGFKSAGRLQNIELLFPNIETRLDVSTAKAGFVNLHIFVSPEDPNHLDEIERFLSRLHFSFQDDRYDCTRAELIRLAKKIDPSKTNDEAALSYGASQFKVNFSQLREVYNQSDWAKNNILFAVSGSANDGTSGVRDAADNAIRMEIERFAHIIFASSAAQREFWLGHKALSPSAICENYGNLKPCLHGCDAHDLKGVGNPFGNRYSWIKGGLEFDALRQACIDPEGRAYVGEAPPHTAMPSQVISNVRIEGAPWMNTPDIPINSGLVAIIGSRGSGKTALADIIAAGCDAIERNSWNADENSSPSFIARACNLIGNATATLTWAGGATETRALNGSDANGHLSFPRARYLSQQFVEELCSSKGLSDGLINEIERVVFDSHSLEERNWTTNFAELREQTTSRYQQARERESQAIADISDRIASELEKEKLVTVLEIQIAQKKLLLQSHNADLAKLVVKGSEKEAAQHSKLSESAQKLQSAIQSFGNQRRTFVSMQDEVKSMRSTGALEQLRQVQVRHSNSGLNPEQWDEFLLIYKGNVEESLTGYINWADQKIKELKGSDVVIADTNAPLITYDCDLSTLPLSIINAEKSRLEQLISADRLTRDQYTALSKRISDENASLKVLEVKLLDAKNATERKKQLQLERNEAYGRVFEAIINQQTVLENLYAPLMKRLSEEGGSLRKLSFTVKRIADVERWAAKAETDLLDLRKSGNFNGRGSLLKIANKDLKDIWEKGSATEIQDSMRQFMDTYMRDILAHAPVLQTQQTEFREWSMLFAKWLFGTDHISVKYDIHYDGIDIRKLSPGTRGIVLLLLYLAIDDVDDRPLIIDQPEENLDPKSVFEELVSLFIKAKSKRQVIMVTHNANLVINTDADQIIIAEAGPHPSGGLPPIKYMSGGLENSLIRKAVCDILEGGEIAFQERARRLRVAIKR